MIVRILVNYTDMNAMERSTSRGPTASSKAVSVTAMIPAGWIGRMQSEVLGLDRECIYVQGYAAISPLQHPDVGNFCPRVQCLFQHTCTWSQFRMYPTNDNIQRMVLVAGCWNHC